MGCEDGKTRPSIDEWFLILPCASYIVGGLSKPDWQTFVRVLLYILFFGSLLYFIGAPTVLRPPVDAALP